MALLETWRKLAYETEMNQNQATEFWNSYFVQEKAIYEQILATPDAPCPEDLILFLSAIFAIYLADV